MTPTSHATAASNSSKRTIRTISKLQHQQAISKPGKPTRTASDVVRPKRSQSPTYIPKTSSPNNEEKVYVLTLLTGKAHHTRMTDVRTKYFPENLNKLDAHLTLFHALPASKLESLVIPVM
jgi:hypothetical protein